MAEFINFVVGVEEDNEEEKEVSDDSHLDSLSPFIDNEETENDINFYCNFDNVETDTEQTLKAEYDKGLEDIENFDKISNLRDSSEDEAKIDEFETSAEKVKCFGESLLPKTKPDEEIEHNEFKKAIDEKLIEQLAEEK